MGILNTKTLNTYNRIHEILNTKTLNTNSRIHEILNTKTLNTNNRTHEILNTKTLNTNNRIHEILNTKTLNTNNRIHEILNASTKCRSALTLNTEHKRTCIMLYLKLSQTYFILFHFCCEFYPVICRNWLNHVPATKGSCQTPFHLSNHWREIGS